MLHLKHPSFFYAEVFSWYFEKDVELFCSKEIKGLSLQNYKRLSLQNNYRSPSYLWQKGKTKII